MATETQAETGTENLVCPECGAEEEGQFCRNCGSLLRGESMILCPRCHQVVPPGEYCNQCGQSLGGLALNLKQLAMAGDAFWVTSEATSPSPAAEPTIFEPDESVPLAEAELPDWLEELPIEEVPDEVGHRIYPALRPIAEQQDTGRGMNFLPIVIVFLLILLVGLMFLVLIFVLQ
jgi:hypothetical protein